MQSDHILCNAESLQESDLLTCNDSVDVAASASNGADEEGRYNVQAPITALCKDHTRSIALDKDDEAYARQHYRSFMEHCTCKTPCGFEGSEHISMRFAAMSEAQRVNTVRCILLALSAPPSCPNELMETDPQKLQYRKRIRSKAETRSRMTTQYAIRGVCLCANAFAAIVQMHPRTIREYAIKVSSTFEFKVHRTMENKRHKGSLSVQSLITLSFLQWYSDLHGMACPTGRGSADDTPVVLLPSAMTISAIHAQYVLMWNDTLESFYEARQCTQTRPDRALGKDDFRKVWKMYMPTLRVMKSGSDFCDTCTTLMNEATAMGNSRAKEVLLQARENHRCEALQEFLYYKTLRDRAKSNPLCMHVVFDFAEKVLLPRLLRKPGQLHFAPGLKFDIFGCHVSNIGVKNVFGLPEGHWPGNKTASEVASMLHSTIGMYKDQCTNVRSIQLHAQNCSGQNKNRYMLFYLAWRVMMKFEDAISLHFLVAGHTKNICDGAFGLVKRRLKERNVLVPHEMMATNNCSSESNQVVCSNNVEWIDWKRFLSQFFSVPTTFRITRYHIFSFSSNELGKVSVQELSDSSTKQTYNLVKRNFTCEAVVSLSTQGHLDEHRSSVKPLSEVPSAQERNRQDYLVKNILERYYPGNESLKALFFADGSDWAERSL